jgi:hypothetical protein
MSESTVAAENLVVNGWKPMGSLPRDGVVYETLDQNGNAGRAHVWRGQLILEGTLSPVMWRPSPQ